VTTGVTTAIANTLVDTITAGGLYLQHYVGDPGAAGTSNTAGDTTRVTLTFPAASSGSTTQTGTASISSWAGGEQTLTHGGLWTAATSGTFRGSFVYTNPRDVLNGDAVNASGIAIAVTPKAA
jgi:hypothetical protein